MARSPIITASITLDNKVSAILKQVEADVVKVTREGNVDAAQLSTVFAEAARKASSEIGRAGEAIQQDFVRISEAAKQTGGAIGQTAGDARNLKNQLGGAVDKGELLRSTLKGVGTLALAVGPALAGAFAHSIDEAKTYERAISAFAAQGYGDDLTRRTAAQAKALSVKYPGVSQTDIVGDAATGLGSFGPDALPQVMEIMTRNRSALVNAGQDPAGLETALRSFENVYGQDIRGGVNKVTGERNPSLDEFLKKQTALKISFAGLVSSEDLSQFFRTGKVASMDLSAAGAARLSTLIGDEGGARAGTELATLSNALVGGHLTKTGKEIAAKLGVYDAKDLVRNKAGDFVPNATAKPKDYELLKTDPVQWARNLVEAAKAKGISQQDVEAMLQKMVSRNAADFLVKAERQYEATQARVERVDRAYAQVDKLPDDHSSLASKLNDAAGMKENNAIDAALPGLNTFADASLVFQKAVSAFDATILKIPGLSGAANIAAGAAVSSVGMPILQGLSLAALFKAFPNLLPKGLRGAPTAAAPAAEAGAAEAGAALATGAEVAGGAAVAGEVGAAGAGALAAGGGGLAALAGLGALELTPVGWALTAGAGVTAGGAGLWALLGKLKASRDAKMKRLNDQFAAHPDSLSSDDLDFLQRQSLADAEALEAKLDAKPKGETPEATAKRVADLKARIKRDLDVANAARAEAIAAHSAPAAQGAPAGQAHGLPGKGSAGASTATLAALAPVQEVDVKGKAEVTLKLELSDLAKKLIAPPAVLPKFDLGFALDAGRNSFDRSVSMIKPK